jgi:D-amino-acid oxidase
VEVVVIGCGVSGLTSGLALLRAGFRVRIWARTLPPETTSNVAAAVWYPYKAYPAERVTAWGAHAYQVFMELADQPGTGVIRSELLDLKGVPSPDPWWREAVSAFRRAAPEELPRGYQDGYVFAAPVIDTAVYLEYLMRAFQAEGGHIERHDVTQLADAFAVAPLVVNCAGLGARELVGDGDLHPSRGQVIRIRHNGFSRVLLDEDGPNQVAYIVPRTHDIVLGGTDDEGNESTVVDPVVTQSILRRCARLDPRFASLRESDILNVVCGLRPVRSSVRLELERPMPERWLIHNYGHGGAGVTLSWGCAGEVVALAGACG